MRRYQQEQLGDVGPERLPIVEHCHAELQLNILRSLYAFDQIQQHFVRQFVQAEIAFVRRSNVGRSIDVDQLHIKVD